MQATIKKIHELKGGHKFNAAFTRVEFESDDGHFYKTDLVPTFRNYKRWQPFLREGTVLSNLKIHHGNEIDADSFPVRMGA